MTNEPEKITRRKLSDEVLDRLRKMIIAGELRPGDTMPSERALMARFGVGRPAVREALQTLHNSGLITISHGERSRVNQIDAETVFTQSDDIIRLVLAMEPANVDHLREARRMFELGMVRLAAERRTNDDLFDLEDTIVRQRAYLSQDLQQFIAADMAFHSKIAQIAGNPIIHAVSRAMVGWLFAFHQGMLHWSGNEEVTLAEHERILDRLRAQDAEGAVAEMATHLDRSSKAFSLHREDEGGNA
ncbi:transcriptional regulator NanR [Ponticoccus alexandrii]|uniref:Transcriptional regulator NanR n=1 Tax=Ponticoccus alexandrii TaxID=1943633 RepID=A0ABX7F454_9RHOB|nr:transcriptional regulator NanR [Ponticoccus alexandrii]ETA53652.1 GntR family transcriptional regulator [Rhodobacteraceae bacterium PD-2]QRF64976.1 transcriptional regulator NanR [Ponticoccus alexandrii]